LNELNEMRNQNNIKAHLKLTLLFTLSLGAQKIDNCTREEIAVAKRGAGGRKISHYKKGKEFVIFTCNNKYILHFSCHTNERTNERHKAKKSGKFSGSGYRGDESE